MPKAHVFINILSTFVHLPLGVDCDLRTKQVSNKLIFTYIGRIDFIIKYDAINGNTGLFILEIAR